MRDATYPLRDRGLLFLRIGVGLMFMYYGSPQLFGGPAAWKGLGMAMQSVGIGFLPAVWGFAAAFSMFVGGICLILGIFFKQMCSLMAFTMIIAVMMHLRKGDSFLVASHALTNAIVFISLLFIGPGKHSLKL